MLSGTLTDDDDDDDDDDDIRKTSILVSTNLCKVPRVEYYTLYLCFILPYIDFMEF